MVLSATITPNVVPVKVQLSKDVSNAVTKSARQTDRSPDYAPQHHKTQSTTTTLSRAQLCSSTTSTTDLSTVGLDGNPSYLSPSSSTSSSIYVDDCAAEGDQLNESRAQLHSSTTSTTDLFTVGLDGNPSYLSPSSSTSSSICVDDCAAEGDQLNESQAQHCRSTTFVYAAEGNQLNEPQHLHQGEPLGTNAPASRLALSTSPCATSRRRSVINPHVTIPTPAERRAKSEATKGWYAKATSDVQDEYRKGITYILKIRQQWHLRVIWIKLTELHRFFTRGDIHRLNTTGIGGILRRMTLLNIISELHTSHELRLLLQLAFQQLGYPDGLPNHIPLEELD